MDHHTTSIIEECTCGSDEERLTFPNIVAQLAAAGIERYSADLCRWEKTYFFASGESLVVPCKHILGELATTFSAQGVESAVRASQSQSIKYNEFCRRALSAGCVGYIVSIVGRRVIYFGRSGEMHIEHFPTAKS